MIDINDFFPPVERPHRLELSRDMVDVCRQLAAGELHEWDTVEYALAAAERWEVGPDVAQKYLRQARRVTRLCVRLGAAD